MKVKGTSFLARKRMITERFGEAAWTAFVERLARTEPVFAQPIVATTLIPVEPYAKMQDLMLATFYNNQSRAYWDMGVASAQWSLTVGPYKGYLGVGDLHGFVKSFSNIWSAYYTEGAVTATLDDKIVHARLRTPFWHIAFELSSMGYFQQALEMYTRRPVTHKAMSGGGSASEVYYQFYL